MSGPRQTAIVTGASQQIDTEIANGFVERGFNVVADSRTMTQYTEVAASNHVALVDGDICDPAPATKIVETAAHEVDLTLGPGEPIGGEHVKCEV